MRIVYVYLCTHICTGDIQALRIDCVNVGSVDAFTFCATLPTQWFSVRARDSILRAFTENVGRSSTDSVAYGDLNFVFYDRFFFLYI